MVCLYIRASLNGSSHFIICLFQTSLGDESSVRLFKHSTDFYQGDIKLGSDVEKNGIVSPSGWKRWPKAKIPYVISINYSNYFANKL